MLPVADLIPLVPRPGENGIRQLVHVGRKVIVRRGDLAASNLSGQLRAVLDDECVRRNVIGAQRNGLIEGCPPVVEALPRSPVNEVETDV